MKAPAAAAVVEQAPATTLQPAGARHVLRRRCACGGSAGFGGACAACQRKRFTARRRSIAGPAPLWAPAIVGEALRAQGAPLDRRLRDFFEPRFERTSESGAAGMPPARADAIEIGDDADPAEDAADRAAGRALSMGRRPGTVGTDFSRVRVHTDERAVASAAAIGALAYTLGDHIVFGAGQYRPATAAGRELIAHELAHVAQGSRAGALVPSLARRKKGGSFGGFFRDIGRGIVDFFTGSEPDYDERTLRDYLEWLDLSGDIEDDYDSDNKARAVVGGELFPETTLRIRILLIKEMLSGFTGDDEETAILFILGMASLDERQTIVDRVGLEELYENIHGDERDRLYLMFPILDSLHPRKKESKTHTLEQYIAKWEAENGVTMTPEEKRVLGRGCIGITVLALGTIDPSVMPDLKECYDNFRDARAAQIKMRRFLAENFPDRRAVLFSKRFWSSGAEYEPHPASGKVEMSGYTYEARPGHTNYDYGLYDEETGKWWHANHCDSTLVMNPRCGGAMEVYESNLAYYSRGLRDFDKQIFCVGVGMPR